MHVHIGGRSLEAISKSKKPFYVIISQGLNFHRTQKLRRSGGTSSHYFGNRGWRSNKQRTFVVDLDEEAYYARKHEWNMRGWSFEGQIMNNVRRK